MPESNLDGLLTFLLFYLYVSDGNYLNKEEGNESGILSFGRLIMEHKIMKL